MYVLSSLPSSQQSLAGGIFNTITKVGTAVGLGITTSIYNAAGTSGEALQRTWRPYELVFWFCVGCSGLGVLCVPFLTITTQGGKDSREQSSHGNSEEDKTGMVVGLENLVDKKQ
jgi:hypothetical protein